MKGSKKDMAEAKTTETKSTTKKTTATKKAEPKVDERDIKLAEQAAELEALKAQMQAVLQAQMTNAQVAAEPKRKKNVSIMSFAVGGLTLMGTRAIRIPKQFDTVSVSESEATAIVNNMPESARNGLFYILDADFVEENELSDAYKNLLDDKQFKQLLTQSSDYVVDIFKSASDVQKKIIINMIIDKKSHNLPIDANIVEQISKLSGVDFDMAIEAEDLDAEK